MTHDIHEYYEGDGDEFNYDSFYEACNNKAKFLLNAYWADEKRRYGNLSKEEIQNMKLNKQKNNPYAKTNKEAYLRKPKEELLVLGELMDLEIPLTTGLQLKQALYGFHIRGLKKGESVYVPPQLHMISPNLLEKIATTLSLDNSIEFIEQYYSREETLRYLNYLDSLGANTSSIKEELKTKD